ncbi:MAG: bifunctional 2',3'-cyclic-nucleotide 2'-phosphodiesterase/3'-nucleotidase, partial [Pseudomonadota bacterium]
MVAPDAHGDETTARLTVLETTDIHVHVIDYDYFRDRPAADIGLVRTAALIQQVRAEQEERNIVLVDNGDLLQGNPMGDFIARERGLERGEIHPVYKVMNELDYTVGNIGNHEFNYGLEFLSNSLAGANFPYISANVYHDDGDDIDENDTHYFDPYLVVDREIVANDGETYPIKIGFIGFVPPQIMSWDQAHLKDRVIAKDMVDAARELVPKMKAEGADVIVAIPHSGLSTMTREGMEENATYYLSTIPDIDAIMFGHSHRVFPSDDYADIDGVDVVRGTINNVAATMPGAWGSHLGIVELDLIRNLDGSWEVIRGEGSIRSIAPEGGDPIEPVEELVAVVAEDHEATIEYMRRAAGEITAPINSYFALVADDPSIQIITDAQKKYVEKLIRGTEYDGFPVLSASAPFKSGGRGGPDYYTRIDAGPIALKNVADLYIYP